MSNEKDEVAAAQEAQTSVESVSEPTGSWGVPGLFEPTAIAIRPRLKMVWYGPAGSGKTMLGIRFPRPILMDTERGWDVYKEHYPQIPVLQIGSFDKANSAVDSLIAAGNRLTAQTLIIDPVTVLYADLKATHLTEEAMQGKAFGTAGYSAIEREWNQFLAKVSNLARRMNIIMTARERPVFNTDSATFDAGRGLDYAADIVLQLFERETGERQARTIKERMMPPRLERHNAYDPWDALRQHYHDSIYGRITRLQLNMINALMRDKASQSEDAEQKFTEWLVEQFQVKEAKALSSYQAMQVINKLS